MSQNTGHNLKWDLQPAFDIFFSVTSIQRNTKENISWLCAVWCTYCNCICNSRIESERKNLIFQ